jgi:hypothetical protein
MDGQNTGEIGGLYPGGSNVRPPEHEADGLVASDQVVPLDADGNPDDTNGKIVMVSIGMSNTSMEFITFMRHADDDPEINPKLILVNGAQHGRTADAWVNPDGEPWQNVYQSLSDNGVTAAQVLVAWVKLTHYGAGDFSDWPSNLQHDLEIVARNLKTNFPNIKIAYFSSRTRAYVYWEGINPEPSAYESGFSVRWMIEKQINGDPSLNFDPNDGEVVAPYLSWGPYLWIDGENPRSDGQVWLQEDLGYDCIHPSPLGRAKAAGMMMDFFKSDTTTVNWFLENPLPEPSDTPQSTETPTPTTTPRATVETPTPSPTNTGTATATQFPSRFYIPMIFKDGTSQVFTKTPLLSILMLTVFGIVLVIKLGARK